MAPSLPLAQALTVLLFFTVFLAFHVRVRLHSNDRLNNIEMAVFFLSTIVLYSGIYLFDDDIRRDVGPITVFIIACSSS